MLTLDAEVLLWAGRGRAGLSALVISRTARTPGIRQSREMRL
jgi:hypothetical protein